MEPTLYVGRRLIVDKLTYRFREPRRGEIILFPSPIEEGKGLVKRVIAVGGDRIALLKKRVYLNDVLLEEPYVQYTREGELLQGDTLEPIELPEGALFVLGDNRDESGDSRDWRDSSGERLLFIESSQVRGRILLFP